MEKVALKRLTRVLGLYQQELKQQELLVFKSKLAVDTKSVLIAKLENDIRDMNESFCKSLAENSPALASEIQFCLSRLNEILKLHRVELETLLATWEATKACLTEKKQKVEALEKFCDRKSDRIASAQSNADAVELLDRVLSRPDTKR